MTSEAKVEANRKNALRSTGPRTAEGKALTAQNATTHGLLSRATVLPSEDAATFNAFADELRAALAPSGALQELLADQAIACAWRLRRCYAVETAIIRNESQTISSFNRFADPVLPGSGESVPANVTRLALTFVRRAGTLAVLSRYESTIDRCLRRTLAELRRLQAEDEELDGPDLFDMTAVMP